MTIVHYSHKINLLYFTSPRLDTCLSVRNVEAAVESAKRTADMLGHDALATDEEQQHEYSAIDYP